MSITGSVQNGVVVLDPPFSLSEGTHVTVEPVAAAKETPKRSLLERLGDVVGKVDGLPPDASQNVDHYLYGAPKQ